MKMLIEAIWNIEFEETDNVDDIKIGDLFEASVLISLDKQDMLVLKPHKKESNYSYRLKKSKLEYFKTIGII